jgi:hypothetical protein
MIVPCMYDMYKKGELSLTTYLSPRRVDEVEQHVNLVLKVRWRLAVGGKIQQPYK